MTEVPLYAHWGARFVGLYCFCIEGGLNWYPEHIMCVHHAQHLQYNMTRTYVRTSGTCQCLHLEHVNTYIWNTLILTSGTCWYLHLEHANACIWNMSTLTSGTCPPLLDSQPRYNLQSIYRRPCYWLLSPFVCTHSCSDRSSTRGLGGYWIIGGND
jgi:hypothetical protein